MNNNDKITVSKDFEKQVAEKIKAIQNYYNLHNNSYDGFENEFKKTVEFIDKLPESKEKHSKYADVYMAGAWQDKIHTDKAIQEAELGENSVVMARMIINKYLHDDNSIDECIEKFSEALPKIKNMPENKEALGQLFFWRGSRYFIKGRENTDTASLDKAKKDFIEAEKNFDRKDVYHAASVAGIKAADIEKNDIEKYTLNSYGVDGERLLFNNGKLIFNSQPGFSHTLSDHNRHDSIFYYISCNFDDTFFDENLELGGKIIQSKGEHTKSTGSTHTLISKNEKVSVLAGTFDDCMYIKLHGLFFGKTYDADVYYARGIGLVKAEFTEGDKVENYELCEYKINNGNAGSEYFPFAVGNVWKYANTNLPPIYWQTIERELVNIETVENEGVYATFSAVDYLRLKKIDGFSENCDSDTYIDLADKALPNEKPKEWDFDTAIKNLKFANQKNTSVRSSLFSHNALDFIERCAEYYKNNWVFLPSSVSGGIISRQNKQGKIIYKENEIYYMGPYVTWGSWYGARRCIGLKPYRFLQELAGTLYSDKWIAGYSETLKNGDGEIYLKAEDGGTITTKAGTFSNCIKVTFNLEWEGGKDDGLYYLHNLRYSHCGTKIYWYAPNVGIVRHDCIWGNALTASIELTEYKSCATSGEYMPVYVGNRWIYDEVTLPSKFIARKKYDLVSGIEDEFFMIEEQEMLFMGTDEEYEEFKKSLNK